MQKHHTVTAPILCACLLFSALLRAGDAKPLRPMTDEDQASLREVATAQLTPDGRWFICCMAPETRGDVFIVIRNVRDKSERRLSAGPVESGGGHLKVSRSGRWAGFLVGGAGAAGTTPDHLAAKVIEVASGKTSQFANVRDFSFAGDSHEQIVLEGYPVKSDHGASELASFDLSIHDLVTGTSQSWPGVLSDSMNTQGTRLAWANEDGVSLREFSSGLARVLDKNYGARYQQLTWSKQGTALGVLRETENAGRVVLAFTDLGSSEPKRKAYRPQDWPEFPAGYEISADAAAYANPNDGLRPALLWREDEKGLYFGIRAKSVDLQAAVKIPTTPNLVLWHWRDEKLPEQKAFDKNYPVVDLCFVSLADGRFVRLTDPSLRQVMPQAIGRHVLGYDLLPDGWRNPSEGSRAYQSRDYYLVDLQTGQRKEILPGLKVVTHPLLSVEPELSPDGSVVIYQDQGDYFVYEVEGGLRRNVTHNLPTKFYYEENNPKNFHQPRDTGAPPFQGWSRDGEYVLISDYFDVWALPLKHSQAMNLTGNGRRENIHYGLLPSMDPSWDQGLHSPYEAPRVDLTQPLYFDMTEWMTYRAGLARRVPGRKQLEKSAWEAADVRYYKASNSDVYFCYRRTIVEGADYYLLSSSWRPTQRLTQINPQLREFLRSPGAKLLTYTTAHGDTMHGVLHLPVGYKAGHAYPTIVYIYEREETSPFTQDVISINQFLPQGYAVLLADIQPRINEAGLAAVEGVTAAVNAAVATGVVDHDRLGLYGHSYGGYETAFIVTQTDMFKAAVPYAGLMDLWSEYGWVYGGGIPDGAMMESDQPFLAGPWWTNWQAFLENSPLFHASNIKTPLLLVHGDKDTSVSFSQSVELFNTLRRMGDKPVVLLQYAGEDHEFELGGSTRRDFEFRMLQFFDHFLKGAPAPVWWSDGVSYYQGQTPIASGAGSSGESKHKLSISTL